MRNRAGAERNIIREREAAGSDRPSREDQHKKRGRGLFLWLLLLLLLFGFLSTAISDLFRAGDHVNSGSRQELPNKSDPELPSTRAPAKIRNLRRQPVRHFGGHDQNYDECEFWELSSYFGCEQYTDRTTPDQEQWRKMRQVYRDTVGPEESSIGHPTEALNGFAVPFSVEHFPDKGRGIVAKADISKGTLVWYDLMVATFRDGHKFRKYILSLANLQVELACDALMWSEVLPVGVDEELRICVNLDEGAMCNNGGEEANLAEPDDPDLAGEGLPPVTGLAAGTDFMIAKRDIKAGEELLCDYSAYHVHSGWSHFGL